MRILITNDDGIDFKGLRQLAVDMFVGGGIGVVLSIILKVIGAKVPELMKMAGL